MHMSSQHASVSFSRISLNSLQKNTPQASSWSQHLVSAWMWVRESVIHRVCSHPEKYRSICLPFGEPPKALCLHGASNQPVSHSRTKIKCGDSLDDPCRITSGRHSGFSVNRGRERQSVCCRRREAKNELSISTYIHAHTARSSYIRCGPFRVTGLRRNTHPTCAAYLVSGYAEVSQSCAICGRVSESQWGYVGQGQEDRDVVFHTEYGRGDAACGSDSLLAGLSWLPLPTPPDRRSGLIASPRNLSALCSATHKQRAR